MIRNGMFALSLGLSIAAGSAAEAVETRPILTLAAAKKIGEACLAKAQAEGWKMHVAVVDIGGDLKYYARMDDAQLLSQEIALAKATTSAKIPRATKELGSRAFSDKGPTPLALVPGLAFFEGGLPIMAADGVHVGGVGVSGSSGENDAICAQAGLDAAKADLQ